ncbi:MAG: SdpI family protein [Lachnospiraceae bacterium]
MPIFREYKNEGGYDMGFFISMFICNLIMPLIMIIAGYCMYKNPPKEINNIIGYRTTMSKKNADTWSFAHNYCGKLWMKIGVIMLVPTILVQIPFINSGENLVGIITAVIESIQLVCLIGSIIPVEKALRQMFDENGNRK